MDEPSDHPNPAMRDAHTLWRAFLDAKSAGDRPALAEVEARMASAIAYDRDDPAPRFLYGVMLAEWWMRGDAPEGTFERARDEYQAGLAMYKDDPFEDRPPREPDDTAVMLHMNLGTLLDVASQQGTLPARTLGEVYEHYNTALQIDPEHRPTQLLLASLLVRLALAGQVDLGALEYAEALFRRVLDIERDNAHAMHELASLLQNLALVGQRPAQAFVEAEQLYRRAIEIEPDVASHAVRLGMLLGVMANNGLKAARAFEEAVALLRRAIELESGDAQPYMALASTLMSLHQHELINLDELEESRQLFERARELHPEDPKVLTTYAMMIISMVQHERWSVSELDRAEDFLRQAIKHDPGNAHARSLLARMYEYQVDQHGTPTEKLDEVEALYREAIELDHDDHESRVDLANLLMRLHALGHRESKALDQAERLYMGAIDALPNDPISRYCLANLLARMADQGLRDASAFDRAEALFQEASQIAPDDVQVVGNHGVLISVMVRAGARQPEAIQGAIDMLQRAIERAPDEATLHLQLNKLYNEAADLNVGPADARTKAIEHAERAYELMPEPTVRDAVAASYLYGTVGARSVDHMFRKAREHWEAVLEEDEHNPGALTGLGIAHSNLVGEGWEPAELLHQGVDCFRRALRVSPDDVHARFQLSTILLQRRNYGFGGGEVYTEVERQLAWLADWFAKERTKPSRRAVSMAWVIERIRIGVRMNLAAQRDEGPEVFRSLLEPAREAHNATELFAERSHSRYHILLARLIDRGAIDDSVRATAEAEAFARALCDDRPQSTDRAATLVWILLGGDGTPGRAIGVARRQEGLERLRLAMQNPRGTHPTPTELELRVMAFMHDHAEARSHLAAIKRILSSTRVRTLGSEYTRVIRTVGDHPEAPWLDRLAAVCRGRAGVETLNEWPAWADVVGG